MSGGSSVPAGNEVVINLFLLGHVHLLPVTLVVCAASTFETELPDDEYKNGDEDDTSNDTSGDCPHVWSLYCWAGCDGVVVSVDALCKATSVALCWSEHAHLIWCARVRIAGHNDSLLAVKASSEYCAHDVFDFSFRNDGHGGR